MQFLNHFNLFQNRARLEIPKTIPAPVDYCLTCGSVLVKVKQIDGIYSQCCGVLLSKYEAGFQVDQSGGRSPHLPPQYVFLCPRCLKGHEQWGPDYSDDGQKTILVCEVCEAELHAPFGFCDSCWSRLADNGQCFNNVCGRYQILNIPKPTQKKSTRKKKK